MVSSHEFFSKNFLCEQVKITDVEMIHPIASNSQSSEPIGTERSSREVNDVNNPRPSTPTRQIYSTTANQDLLNRLKKEKQRAKSTL